MNYGAAKRCPSVKDSDVSLAVPIGHIGLCDVEPGIVHCSFVLYAEVKHGIRADDPETRASQMPAFGQLGMLSSEQVSDVAEYVLSLSDNAEDTEAAARGEELYATNCATCHGPDGKGNQALGAPNLSDELWLYGGEKAAIVETITYSRAGMMPSFYERLDPATIKQLAIYVHSLGGGQ